MIDHIRMVMPSLSDHQYDQRGKLMTARSWVTARNVQNDPPPHARLIYDMVGEVVNMWLFAQMNDAVLDRLVDYCRLLMKCGLEAEWLFNDEQGRRDNGVQ